MPSVSITSRFVADRPVNIDRRSRDPYHSCMRWKTLARSLQAVTTALLCWAVLAAGAARIAGSAPTASPGFVDIGGVLAPICASNAGDDGPVSPLHPHGADCDSLCLNSHAPAGLAPETAQLLTPPEQIARRINDPRQIIRMGRAARRPPIRGPPSKPENA